MLMNLESIKKRVQWIEKEAPVNDAAANALEQHLYLEFILHVERAGTKRLRELASAVLTSRKVKFNRGPQIPRS